MANEQSTPQTKNPIFWGLILFVGGILTAFIGYLKQESTVPGMWHWSGFLMITGLILFLAGVVIWFSNWRR